MIAIKNISGTTLQLHLKEFQVDEVYTIPEVEYTSWATNDQTLSAITNEEIEIHDDQGVLPTISEQIYYLQNRKPTKVLLHPFADKTGYNFSGNGAKFVATANATTNLRFTVPEGSYDFTGLVFYHDDARGDTANLRILDSEQGTYSGYPNVLLNQFAVAWNVRAKECGEKLPYSARLMAGMQIEIQYYNHQSTNQNVEVNYYLHKVV